MLNLDTHIFLYALSGNLKKGEKNLLSKNAWGISSIVIWEITKLSQLKKINLNIHSKEFTKILNQIQIWQIDIDICRRIHDLDFKSDPADEIIAATSIVLDIPLLTRDKKIKKSKIVPFAL
jgi:PIN domain nuclease of toxin-antitoxin system